MTQGICENNLKSNSIQISNMVEQNLVFQCAPLFAGLKISNLFIIPNEYAAETLHVLGQTTFSVFELFTTDRRTTFLVYQKQKMWAYLQREPVSKMLKRLGYGEDCRKYDDNRTLNRMLMELRNRYVAYMSLRCRQFPHELGLFLGYPIEDVKGFIRNHGQNFLYSGYWKVYGNPPLKRKIFHRYDMAFNKMQHMLQHGISILSIITNFSK